MDVIELAAQRKATRDLIEDRPFRVSLVRQEVERTPAGGVRKLPPVTLPERARYFGGISAPVLVTTTQGERVEVRHVLIGSVGDDIKKDDEFRVGPSKFRVTHVDPTTLDYQTKAFVLEVT